MNPYDMKRIAVAIVAALLAIAVPVKLTGSGNKITQSFFKGTGCTVDRTYDLGGAEITLPEGFTITFKGNGKLVKGVLKGNASKLVYKGEAVRFENVSLSGTWSGHVDDFIFLRPSDGSRDHLILSNIMKFNDVNISRDEYFVFKWSPILLNEEEINVEGNGVKIYLPSDKGGTHMTRWGTRYDNECIFSSRTDGRRARFADISIIDNPAVRSGWGTDVTARMPVLLYYFAPTHHELIFENVHTDGPGTILEVYNHTKQMSSVVLKGCEVKTCQFGVEIANVDGAKCGKVLIDSCHFIRYPQCVFCGPVSIVGDAHSVDSVIIRNSVLYEVNGGNVEMTGVDHAVFTGNNCTNASCYVGDVPPITMECTGNVFNLKKIEDETRSVSLNYGGERLVVSHNSYNVLSKPYPFTILLQPGKTEYFEFSHNSIHYAPEKDLAGFSCLFNFKRIKGEFRMFDNNFKTEYAKPEFCSYFPARAKLYEDPFKGKITVYRTN